MVPTIWRGFFFQIKFGLNVKFEPETPNSWEYTLPLYLIKHGV